MNVKTFVGFARNNCVQELCRETRAKKPIANLPAYPAVSVLHSTYREEWRLPRDCQRHLALPKTMPTDVSSTCVGARTDGTTRAATMRGVANFRARVLAYVQYAPKV